MCPDDSAGTAASALLPIQIRRNDFIGILLTQRMMDSPEPPAIYQDFWKHAYRTLEA